MKKITKTERKSSKKLASEEISNISGGRDANSGHSITDVLNSRTNRYTTRKPRGRP